MKPNIVATCVEPLLRTRLDAATGGQLHVYHTESVQDIFRTVREKSPAAILISPEYVERSQMEGLAALVQSFPSVQAVALVASHSANASRKLLQLGGMGIRRMVDVTRADGWMDLRNLVQDPSLDYQRLILARVREAATSSTTDFKRFLEMLVVKAPESRTVGDLCRFHPVKRSTFISRFFRAGLPSPKDYLTSMRLVHCAAMLEDEGLSIADVIYRMEYSSPQSFGRHVKLTVGTTPTEFRKNCNFDLAMDEFNEAFINRFGERLGSFHPYGIG